MSKLITQEFREEKVTFYFGTRIFALMETQMGIEDMSQFATRFEKPRFSDIATMLYLAHENACFINKCDLVIKDVDSIYELIDELGIDVAQSILEDGISSLMNVKKVPTTKKKMMKP